MLVNTAAETFAVNVRVRIISGQCTGETGTITGLNQPEPAWGTGDYGCTVCLDGETWQRTYYGANLQRI
jgi:hypothetical protein